MVKRSQRHQQSSGRPPPPARVTKRKSPPSAVARPLWKSTGVRHAPGFWDLLTERGISIDLTRRALQEFDRRNAIDPDKASGPKASGQEYFTSDIKRFARHADYSNLRGYPEPFSSEMGRGQSKASASSKKPKKSQDRQTASGRVTTSDNKSKTTTKSSAYDANFMSLLISDGISPPQDEVQPNNFKELCDMLEPRGSPPPTDTDYHDFRAAVRNAHEEPLVMIDVISQIKGRKIFPSAADHLCRNLTPITSSRLVIPKLDFFDGEPISQADKVIRETLSGLIVPSTSSKAPYLPNFFLEAKAPKGSSTVLRRQAVYDGAFGARAMHYLQAFLTKEVYDNKAYTISVTYYDGGLNFFAHHRTAPDEIGMFPPCYTVPIGQWTLDDNVITFRLGVAAFKNARDWARKHRKAFVAGAIKRLREIPLDERKSKIAVAAAEVKKVYDLYVSDYSSVVSDESESAVSVELQNLPDRESDNESEATVVRDVQAKKLANKHHGAVESPPTKRKPRATRTGAGKAKATVKEGRVTKKAPQGVQGPKDESRKLQNFPGNARQSEEIASLFR